MMKISIKREQSQAGLSFAERENRRSLAGGESKFRPQVKNKLLLLLALLLTAATGAWAQSTPSVKKLTVPDTWTGDMTTFSAADLPSDFAAVGDDVVTTIPAPTATGNAVLIYGFSGGETKFVEYANGVQSATDSRDFPRDQIYGYVNIMGYEGVYYTAPAGYSVSMKDGVKDADKWTVKVGEGQAQALPIGGLKGDGSETVTLQYTGRLKVKGVKATSEATAEPAKEPATVTTAPTGAAELTTASAETEKLVTGGVADGGTLKYAITSTTTQPDDAAFTLTSPTVSDLKTALSMSTLAAGTYYVWYKVFADADHADSEAAYVSVAVAEALPALSITSPSVGQVIGSDGKNYAAASVPSGVTKVAMIAYVSGSNGLAIALADEGSLNWETAKSTCEAKTPAFTNGTWKLPTQDEWNQMLSANGGSEESYTGLNTAITTAGGTTLQWGKGYWSSTPDGSKAYYVWFQDGDTDWRSILVNIGRQVRACLAF